MALLRVLEMMDASGSEPIEELRGRCQKLLLKHHPDKTQDADLELYGYIQTVWKALSSFESWRTLLTAQENKDRSEEKPVWKDIVLSEMTRTGDMLVHSCRCGGNLKFPRKKFKNFRLKLTTCWLIVTRAPCRSMFSLHIPPYHDDTQNIDHTSRNLPILWYLSWTK